MPYSSRTLTIHFVKLPVRIWSFLPGLETVQWLFLAILGDGVMTFILPVGDEVMGLWLFFYIGWQGSEFFLPCWLDLNCSKLSLRTCIFWLIKFWWTLKRKNHKNYVYKAQNHYFAYTFWHMVSQMVLNQSIRSIIRM